MAIETYLIEDSEKMIAEPEHLEEWTKTVQELNLTGQQELMKEGKSPIPFNIMNTEQERVYGQLCPNQNKVKAYKNETIPLRVLSLIALAEREKYFEGIEIWDNNMKPDPIAVGIVAEGKYGRRCYLIARWGDELRAYTELKQIAMKSWIEEAKRRLKEKISEANLKLQDIEGQAEKHFSGQWVSI